MKTLYFFNNHRPEPETGGTPCCADTTERPVCPTRTVKNHNRALFLWLSFMLLVLLPGFALGADTGWLSPSTNPANSGVANPTNVYSSNNVRANYDNGGDNAQYGNFSITTIPVGATINGIEVRIEGYRSSSTERNLTAALSYNNGTNYTTPELQFPINVYTSGTETYFSVGGSTHSGVEHGQ